MEERPPSRKTDTVVALAIGGVVLAALLLASQREGSEGPSIWDAIATLPQPVASPPPEDVSASRTRIEAEPVAEASSDNVEEDPEFVPTVGRAPSFDIVRVDPRGSGLVAGYAEPGAEVSIMADGAALATAEADADGNFVAFFDTALSSAPVALSMEATRSGAAPITSEEVVMLFPRDDASDGTGPGPVEPMDGASVPAVEKAPEVAATAIIRQGAVEVSSMLDEATFVEADQVTLGSIAYSPDGQIELSGAGPAETSYRIYIDNNLRAEGFIGANGRWLSRLDDLEEGLYRLRVDQLDAKGQVGSRVETPFQRDLPKEPRPRPGADIQGNSPGILATVQPGGTLWTLSRVHYGSGVHYALIFTANRELIRDPDLIYPGQVLTIPGFE